MKMILVLLVMLLSPVFAQASFSIIDLPPSQDISLYQDGTNPALNTGSVLLTYVNDGPSVDTLVLSKQYTQGSDGLRLTEVHGSGSNAHSNCQNVPVGHHCRISFMISGADSDWPTPVLTEVIVSGSGSQSVPVHISALSNQPIYDFQVLQSSVEVVHTSTALTSTSTAVNVTLTLKNEGNRKVIPEFSVSPDLSGLTILLNRCNALVAAHSECIVIYRTTQTIGQTITKTFSAGYGGVVTDTAQIIINGYKPFRLTTVGNDNKLYRSTNNGVSFSELTFNNLTPASTLYDVSGSNITANLFSTTGNSVQISNDNGSTFSPVAVPGGTSKSVSLSGSKILSVTYNRKFHNPGYYTSDYSSVQLSLNGGVSFSQITLPSAWTKALYGQVDGSNMLLVDSSPMKASISSDNGVTYSSLTLPPAAHYVEQILISGNDVLLFDTRDVLGQSQGTWISHDAGLTYAAITMPTTNLSEISQVGLSGGYVFFKVYSVTSLSTSLKITRNHGTSYQAVQNPASNVDTKGYVLELN